MHIEGEGFMTQKEMLKQLIASQESLFGVFVGEIGKYKIVTELDEIEIYFYKHTDSKAHKQLVDSHWLWNRKKGCWYTKYSPEAEQLAKKLCKIMCNDLQKLLQLTNEIKIGINELKQKVDECEKKAIKKTFNINDILYIYKGYIICHRNKHNIIQATAILHNQTDREITLNVEYCTQCKKFFLDYTSFEQYRERYGALIGNLRLVTNGEFAGSYELAQESPLHIIGYNVGQKDDFSQSERQYILARVLHNKIMAKGEVIKYLTFFIRRNGAKLGNELALLKWKEDLAFVQEYDINTQPRAIIAQIKKY